MRLRIFWLSLVSCVWAASDQQNPRKAPPLNSTWLHDVTPRGSLVNTIAANREVWLVAALHENSKASMSKADDLVAIAKSLNGVARVGYWLCNRDCVHGCCKDDSLSELLGSRRYPSLHLVLPWPARDGSAPIPGHEGISTLVGAEDRWKPAKALAWVSGIVPYGGHILKTDEDAKAFYDIPLMPKLVLVSSRKGVPLMFKLLRWQFGDTVEFAACKADRGFLKKYVKEAGAADFKPPALLFTAPPEGDQPAKSIKYEGPQKRYEIANFIKAVMPFRGALVQTEAKYDSFLLSQPHLPKVLLVTSQRTVPYLARRLATHFLDKVSLGVSRHTAATKPWLKSRLRLQERQLPMLIMHPRRGDTRRYDKDGLGFSSLVQFVQEGLDADQQSDEQEEQEEQREQEQQGSPGAAEEAAAEPAEQQPEQQPAASEEAPPSGGWMDWFSGSAPANVTDPPEDNGTNETSNQSSTTPFEPEPEPEPEKSLEEQQFEQLAVLDEAELWDAGTRKSWRSNPQRGVVKKDWEMHRPALYELQALGLVPLCRTVPPFHDIDLDGNGRVNKREYLLHAAAMKQMPATLTQELQLQHGFRVGDLVRWIGKFEAPWQGSPKPALVKEFGRDVEGRVFVLVESPGDLGPNVSDTSFASRYEGRKVRITDVELTNERGEDLSEQVQQQQLSAAAVFGMLNRGAKWADGDDEDWPVIMAEDIKALNLSPLIPTKEASSPLSRERFIALFHRYRFQPELFHAFVSLRSPELAAKADQGHQTACGGTKYCLNPRDIRNFKLSLQDVARFSPEFRRFGRVTMEKRVGFSNTLALIRAMIERRNRRISQDIVMRPMPVEGALERLQLQASALSYLNNDKHVVGVRSKQDDSVTREWAGALGQVRVLHQLSASLKQPRNAVLLFPNSTLQVKIFPAAEALAWIRFLEQMANPVRSGSGVVWSSDGNSTVGPSESLLRAKDAYVHDVTHHERGYGYVAVTRCEKRGVMRVLVKANMYDVST